MPPKRSTAASTAASASSRAGDVEPGDEQVVRVAERLGDGVGVAAGGHDVVAGGQRGLGDVDAQAAAGAGDDPGLLLGGHDVQQSTDGEGESPCRERYPQGPPAARPRVYAGVVETKKEIQEFLTSRRAAITPEQAGLPTYGARRVPGLRREEVAVLAGVSVPYYTRLERGDLSGVSEGVLEALAGALQLDDAERAHLFDLARAAQPTGAPQRRRATKPRIRPEIQWTLDAITGAAAYVGNDRLDILATNELGRALFSELYAAPTRPANFARFVLPRPARRSLLPRLGPRRPRPPPRSCARPPAATRTTATCQTSSASSRPRARRSAPTGPPTTSASMPPPSSASTTPSSASSASASTAWTSPPTTG